MDRGLMYRLLVPLMVVCVVVLFAFWFLLYMQNNFLSQGSGTATAAPAAPLLPGLYSAAGPVVVRHTLQSGANTYRGTVTLNSTCDTFSASPLITGANPVHVTLAFIVVQKSSACVSQGASAPQPFSLSFTLANTQTTPVFDGVTVNGNSATSNVVEQ